MARGTPPQEHPMGGGRWPLAPEARSPETAPMIPAAYEPLVAPARIRPSLWRLALGVLLIALLWTLGGVAVFVGAGLLLAPEPGQPLAQELAAGETARATLVLLATFFGLFAAPFLAARWIHARRPPRLIGPLPRALRHFGLGMGVVLAVYAANLAIWAAIYDSAPGLPPAAWLSLLPLVIALLLVQTGAEELAFRGYLQSQLAARFASPLVWMVIPSLLFGAMHVRGDVHPGTLAVILVQVTLFGLIAADLTARTGSLGAAWGIHFANNFVALALLSVPGSLSGVTLRLSPYGLDVPPPLPIVALDVATLGLVWVALTRLLPRTGALAGIRTGD